MTLNEYQELARRTQNNDLLKEQKQMHALHGLASEVGEIHSIFQKLYQGHKFDTDKVKDEMSDVLWFLGELADSLDIKLDDIARHNIDKLRARYPEGFDVEHSVNRPEYRKG